MQGHGRFKMTNSTYKRGSSAIGMYNFITILLNVSSREIMAQHTQKQDAANKGSKKEEDPLTSGVLRITGLLHFKSHLGVCSVISRVV